MTDPNGVYKQMDCPATFFVDDFLIISTFSVILLVFGRPEHSSSTDTQPAFEHEYHSKTTVRLKNGLQTSHDAFQGFW
jgi:hypothetical protein